MDCSIVKAAGPLSGIRVLEFCQVAAGPFCGMLFADLGADVIKIEGQGGDSMRQWPPFNHGYSENFASLNRSKRSIVLNLKSPEERDLALKLVRDADIVLENNRPKVMERLGLGYAALAEIKPDLVYCSISAFGQTGPRATEGGFDLTIQGVAGVMSVTGEPGAPPVKCGVPISDFTAGLYAAYAALAALFDARRTGKGAHIDVPMMGVTLGVSALQTSQYFGSGIDPGPLGSAHPRNAPYQAFEAGDGYFVMAAGNDKLWISVCEITGLTRLASDSRFKTQLDRATNQRALKDLIEVVFRTQPVAHWLRLLAAAGVPSGPINSISQALADPQVAHAGWVSQLELPGGGVTRTFGWPVGISGWVGPDIRSPPALDEHGADIRAELLASARRSNAVEADKANGQ
ncbi:CaiB/BaiF CoA transferase family protein [Bradyrhizobium mercantei]|uniref:CaiB/BaiF CoA transferase family protein n=1 Tax=Bradyrhizobium mercantei TaxID=1904807 RepID=UPI0024BF20C0|nr:CoA transferase [Bradyrhizobium mercantei]